MGKIQINIDATITDFKELSQLVKNLSEMKKERNCDCVLNVKILHQYSTDK